MEITNEQKVLQQVINEAWENEVFKNELIANPLTAIEKLTGQRVQLKEGQTLVVRDQTDESTIYINIPAEQNIEDVELNEEQLEAVAGGVNLNDLHIWIPQFPVLKTFPVNPSLDGYKKI